MADKESKVLKVIFQFIHSLSKGIWTYPAICLKCGVRGEDVKSIFARGGVGFGYCSNCKKITSV